MLEKDDKERQDLGVVSFAILGVFIIILSIFAVAYISRIDRINYENELRRDSISELEDSLNNTFDSLEEKIKYIGVKSAFESGSNHEGNLSRSFLNAIDNYMDDGVNHRRWDHGGIKVELNHYDLTIGPKSARINEIIPEEKNNESINNDGPGVLKERDTTFSYEVLGTIYLVASEGSLELENSRDVSITIDVPYPFMRDKMQTFDTNLRGDKSHLARITEYTLTTLAQYRTLAGYGMESLDCNGETFNKTTDEIITKGDVELTVNLALLFEIAYHYRSYDPEHLDSIINNVSYLNRDRLKHILSTYLYEDSIDPGDIISLFHSYSYDDKVIEENQSVELDISIIVAQAMNALVDQFVLKHLENLRITPVLDLIFRGMQKAEEIYESITDFIFEDDEEEDEINPQQVQTVKEWVRSIFISAGLMDTHLFRNYYSMYDRFQGKKISGYPNLPEDFKFTDNFRYYSRLDGEEFEWYEYSCDHNELHRKSGDTCDKIIQEGEDDEGNPVKVRCGAEERKAANDFRVGTVQIEVQSGPLSFQPVDILDGNEKTWQQFYDECFKNSVDEDPDNINDAVKEIIQKLVQQIMENDNINDIIQEYNNIEVDPTDDISLMESIQVNVDAAIYDVVEHFRRNPDEIASILKTKLHEEGDPKVEDLIYFLNENYNHLVTRTPVKLDAAEKTAFRLTDPGSPHLEFEEVYHEINIDDYYMKCDFGWTANRTINKRETSDIIQNGNVFGTTLRDDLSQEIMDSIDGIYQEVRKREVHISDSNENVSEEDGLIIQALNHYQHNTSYESESHLTRSGSPFSWIREISPDPATQDQDTISFIGNSSLSYEEVEWKSDLDGHLSNDIQFNRSARFMSSGQHEITLRVLDEEGMIHEDKETLFINIPPEACIKDISPDPATEFLEVTFEDSSWDPDGFITDRIWAFGDGNYSEGEIVNHTYTSPGLYTVNLTVWDDKGGFDTAYREILVDDAPRVIDIVPDTDQRWDTYTEVEVIFSEPVDPSSLQYSIEPYVEYEKSWKENNTILVLKPIEKYSRDTKYELTIYDVEDVDNGTASNLLEPVSVEWLTIEFGKILEVYPEDKQSVDIQRSIVLVLDESAYISDFDSLINQDWNWTYSWDYDHTHLILDHDKFTPGTRIDLTFDLSELRSRYDGSSFKDDGENSLTLTLNTKTFDNPTLTSMTPGDGADEVMLNKYMRLNFDKSINVSSFGFNINPHVDDLTYHWNDNNKSVLITHDGFLNYQEYRVFIEAQCEEGLQLTVSEDNNTSNPFIFKTEDISTPKVVQISPRDGTEHILSNSPIVIQFNKKINTNSLEYSCNPNPGYWEYEWNSDGNILILRHGGFVPGREVTFILEDASDMRGNSLSEEIQIEFKISDNGEHIEGNLFQRKLWSFIGGGPYSESLFDITEVFMRETTSNMILSSEMSNLEYRVPSMVESNFDYYHMEENASNELELIVDLQPGYLNIEDNISISEPSGHHFTEVTTISSRPFKTEWDIFIPNSEIFLDIKRKTPYMLGDEEPSFLSLNETYFIGFDLSISVASGWALEDVEYTRDDIDLSTVIDFLNRVWDLLKKPLSYLLDGLYKILELFDNIVNRLKEHAASLVEYLGVMIENLVNTTLRSLTETILENKDKLVNLEEVLSLLGINMGLYVYEDGKSKSLPNTDTYHDVFLKIDIGGAAFGTTLDLDFYVLDNNVVATGVISSDHMDVFWQIDPMAQVDKPISVYDSWFQSQGEFGEEGDGAILHLEIPEIERDDEPDTVSYEYSIAEVFPPLSAVSIPIGPVVVSNFDFGLEITYIDLQNISSKLIHGSIRDAFWNTVEHMSDSNFNVDYIVGFVRTFADLLLEELIRFLQSVLDSIELFFTCTVNQIDIVVSFGLASAEGIIDFIKWIGQQVRHLLQSISKRKPSCHVDSLPSSILEETELSVEVGLEDASTVEFSVNVPALASIIGRDIGEWRIGFGVELGNGLTLVKGQLVEW